MTAVAVGRPFLDHLQASIERARGERGLEPVTVIVPTRFSAYFLPREIVSRGSGLFNVNFIRLDDFADRLLPADSPKRPLSRLHAAELVYGAVTGADLPASLREFREHPSFHQAVHRSIDELRTAPAPMVRALAGKGEVARTVAGLRESYAERAAAFEDRLDTARAAAHALESDPVGRLARFGRVILTVIEDPAPQYRPLLDALLAQPGVELIVGITGSERADARVRSITGVPGDAEALADGDAATTLVTAPDVAEEVRWVVRNVVRLARCGTRLGRIAVLFDDPAYGRRVDEALRLAGIPASGPDPYPLLAAPEGRFVTGLLEAAGGLARDDVMAWLTGSPVRTPAGGALHAARWDAISRSAGVTRGLDSWRTRLAAYAENERRRARAGLQAGEIDEASASGMAANAREAKSLLSFVESFNDAAAPPGEGASWSAFAGWLRGLLETYMAPPRDGAGARLERLHGLYGLLDELGSLDEIEGKRPGFERFSAVLRAELDRPLRAELDRPLRSARKLGHGVFVAPLRQAVGTWFEAVHVLGMSEGSYPSPPLEDPLLPDSLRSQVDPAGEALLARAGREAATAREYLTALACAGHRYLLRPRSRAGERRAGVPSRWFVEAARKLEQATSGGAGALLHASEIASLQCRPWLVHVGSAHSAIATGDEETPADEHEYGLLSLVRWQAAGRRANGHFLARPAGSVLGTALRAEAGRYGSGWGEWDGNLASGPPAPAEGVSSALSPTRLEMWASCPFRYFLTHVLGIAATEKPEDLPVLSALDRGTLIHRVLERFVKTEIGLRETGAALDRESGQSLVLKIAREEFDSAEQRGQAGRPVLWAVEKARMERELIAFVGKDAERRARTGQQPVATELKFGMGKASRPAVELDLPGVGAVRFRGIIDRVDATPDGETATVIDYKTGGVASYLAIAKDPTDHGRRVQLPIYARAASSYLASSRSVEAFYWFVSEAEGFRTIGASLADAEEPMKAAVAVAVDGIRRGVFPAHPGDPRRSPDGSGANCRNCPFTDRVCAAGRLAFWERRRRAPELASYLALTGEASE